MRINELDFITYVNKLKTKLEDSTPSVPVSTCGGAACELIDITLDKFKNYIDNIRDGGCDYRLNNVIDYRLDDASRRADNQFQYPLGGSTPDPMNGPRNHALNNLQASNQRLKFTNEKYYFSLAKNYILLFIIIISVYLFAKFKNKGTNSGFGGINISFNFLSNPIYLLILLIIILSTIYIIYLVINKKFIFK